jgi:hypothetical protein
MLALKSMALLGKLFFTGSIALHAASKDGVAWLLALWLPFHLYPSLGAYCQLEDGHATISNHFYI